MLSIQFLWVGKSDDREYARAVDRYVARISRWAKVAEHAVRPEPERSRAAAAREAPRLLAKVTARDRLVALEASGKTMTTEAFAAFLSKHRDSDPRRLTFAVGGASGLDRSVVEKADLALSLSAMTFPHQLARVILLEQVYRALSILGGLSYH